MGTALPCSVRKNLKNLKINPAAGNGGSTFYCIKNDKDYTKTKRQTMVDDHFC